LRVCYYVLQIPVRCLETKQYIYLMSDSLRDQLLQAGFKEKQASKPPKKAHNKKRKEDPRKRTASDQVAKSQQHNKSATASKTSKDAKRNSSSRSQPHATQSAAEQEAIARKKAIKEKIRVLIEEHRIKEHAGEEIYSYQVGSRVRQLFVKAEYRTDLSAGKLLITRLNGNTYLIPPDIADQVLALNPEWAIIHNQREDSTEDPHYADYQIPDDLSW